MRRIFFFGILLMLLGVGNTYYQFSQLPPNYYKTRIANINFNQEQKVEDELTKIERYFKRVRSSLLNHKYGKAIKLIESGQEILSSNEVPAAYKKEYQILMLELYMDLALKQYAINKDSLNKTSIPIQQDYLLKTEALLKKINKERNKESLNGK